MEVIYRQSMGHTHTHTHTEEALSYSHRIRFVYILLNTIFFKENEGEEDEVDDVVFVAKRRE
jgi:hypothetical protein